MIYLENKTELQELWIPRNDGQGIPYNPTKELEGIEVTITEDTTVVHPSSGYYGMSAVTIDASEYGQSNYDEGFDDGYADGYSSGTSDGEQSVIDTFTSTTITINGQYGSSANPYSSVTVDVAQTGHTDEELQEAYESGYTSGSTDGYNSGYTSGETHQKSLLVSTAFTENGTYTRENGYSAITVNVPTGQTYNIEENHPFTATANGSYTITPTSATTLFRKGYEDGVDYFFTASTYPSVGYFEIGTILMEDNDNDNYHIIVFFNNGRFGYDATEWTDEGYHFYTNQQSPNNELYLGFDEDEYVYSNFSEGSGFTVVYDAMSAVSLNVNVETASTYQSGYTSGYTDGQNSIIDTFTAMTATTNGVYGSSAQPLSSITVNVQQTGGTSEKLYVTVNGIKKDVQYYGESVTNWTVVNENYTTSETLEVFYVHYYNYKFHIYLLPSGKYGYWDEDENNPQPMNITTINGSATTQDSLSTYTMTEDGAGLIVTSNNPSFYDILVSYEKEPSIPLSSITITANTAITETDFAYSSITVNVPQTGSSKVISLVDYVHTQTMSDMSSDYIVTGIYPTTATTMRIKYQGCGLCPYDKIVGFAPDEPEYSGVTDSNDYRYAIHIGDKNTLLWDYNNSRIELHSWESGYFNPKENGVDFDLSFGNNYMYNNLTETYLKTGRTQTRQATTNVPIMVNVSTIKLKSLEIWDNGVKVFDGQAAIDSDGNIGLYDTVSMSMVYNSGLTMAYEGTPTPIPSPDYQSGYTDGYNEAISDVIDSAETLTVTANGSYSTALIADGHLWNEVVVNVYQSGFSDADLVGMITRDTGFTYINIPSACTKIGYSAFKDSFITGVTIPNTVETIELDAFAASSLKSVTIPDSVTTIMEGAFNHCANLTAVTLSNSLTYLNDDLFAYCYILSSITIPSSVSSLGSRIFDNCPRLTDIYCYATTAPSKTLSNPFYGINQTGTVHYPAGSDYSSWQNDSNLSGWTFVSDL